jgi:hypothetical protein
MLPYGAYPWCHVLLFMPQASILHFIPRAYGKLPVARNVC